MLNGVAPILIFNFKKLVPQFNLGSLPLLSDDGISIPLIPIPLYLDERLTGIIISSQNKNIDIRTDAETLPDGDKPKAEQKGLNSSVTVTMKGSSSSLGVNILLALIDQIFEKVTSQEYSVTYINKAVTVFGGLLDSFSVNESDNSDEYTITLTISKVTGNSTVENVGPTVLNKLNAEEIVNLGNVA